jgi:hypothetical protein
VNTGASFVVSAVGNKAEETVAGLLWAPPPGTALSDGTWPSDGTDPSDVWESREVLVGSLGSSLSWSPVLTLVWLVATASLVVEVLEAPPPPTIVVLVVSEYVVSAPVSVGTALGKVELGAAGSVVGCT